MEKEEQISSSKHLWGYMGKPECPDKKPISQTQPDSEDHEMEGYKVCVCMYWRWVGGCGGVFKTKRDKQKVYKKKKKKIGPDWGGGREGRESRRMDIWMV